MEAGSPRRLSLDTNVLFDLADEKDFAHDFRETYQRKGYPLDLYRKPSATPACAAMIAFTQFHKII